MADMRDFPTEPVTGSTFQSVNQDFGSERIHLEDEGLENSDIRPLDENSGLDAFHTVEPEESGGSSKLIGALAVALIIGGAGVFAFTTSMHSSASKPALIAASTPSATPVAPAPAPMSAPQQAAATVLDNSTPATPDATPATPLDQHSSPIRAPHIRSARSQTREVPDVTPVPQRAAAAQPSPAAGQSTLPEAVSPPVPPSSFAANAPGGVTPSSPAPATAQDMPAPQPAPQDNTQAQNQTPVQTPAQTPAPATPDQSQPATPQPATPDNSQPAQPQ